MPEEKRNGYTHNIKEGILFIHDVGNNNNNKKG